MSAAAVVADIEADLVDARAALGELESRLEQAWERARKRSDAMDEAARSLAASRELAKLRAAAADSTSEAAMFERAVENQERVIEGLEARRADAERDAKREALSDMEENGRAIAAAIYEELRKHLADSFVPRREELQAIQGKIFSAAISTGASDLAAQNRALSVWDAAPGVGGALERMLMDLADDGPRVRREKERESHERMMEQYARSRRAEAERLEAARAEAERLKEVKARQEAERTQEALERALAGDRVGANRPEPYISAVGRI